MDGKQLQEQGLRMHWKECGPMENEDSNLLSHTGPHYKVLSVKAGDLPRCANIDVCMFLTPEPNRHQLRSIIMGQLFTVLIFT